MRLPYIFLTALYCWVIFVSSSNTDPPELPMIPQADKLAHLVLFGGLAALVSIGLRHGNRLPSARVQFWLPVAFAVFYGFKDEFHQFFVPNRSPSLADIAADTCGALLAQAFLCFYLWRMRWNLAE